MKKILGIFAITATLAAQNATAEGGVKGLNVLVTSGDPQTQMMSLILSMQTLAQAKEVHMVLCADAGVLAEKSHQSVTIKPVDKTPSQMLKAIIAKGADVQVCPLYLPNADKDESVLVSGVKVADPEKVAARLLDPSFHILSY